MNYDQPFTGTLDEMLSGVMSDAERLTELSLWLSGKQLSVWLEYNGPDCASFKGYIRFGHDRIVLATLIGTSLRADERVVRKGRMPKIIEACSKVRPLVYVESVVSPELRRYLEATGFTAATDYQFTYYKKFE